MQLKRDGIMSNEIVKLIEKILAGIEKHQSRNLTSLHMVI